MGNEEEIRSDSVKKKFKTKKKSGCVCGGVGGDWWGAKMQVQMCCFLFVGKTY